MITIKINAQLDYVDTEVTAEDGVTSMAHRWRVANSDPRREQAIMEAKADCFDLLWQYTELGKDVKIVPYLN